jgi:hypothetical protein
MATKTRSICKRCHRLRQVSMTGHCFSCTGELRGMEQRRPLATAATANPDVATVKLSRGSAEVAPLFILPDEHQPDDSFPTAD